MALVRNTLNHEIPLTVGQIGPDEELNVDTSLPYEASLLGAGTLVIVDPSTPPPAPASMNVDLLAKVPYATPAIPFEVDLRQASGIATLDDSGKLKPEQAPIIDLANLGFDPETESEAGVAHAALQTQIDAKIAASEKGAANGVATLDSALKLPSSQLPSSVVSSSAKQLAAVPDLLVAGSGITYDSNGVIASAPVVWPDGDTGTYTTTSATTDGVLAYTVTKGALTYTQPAMTRNSDGAVTNRPAITVA